VSSEIAPTTLGRYLKEIEAAKNATAKELKALGYKDNSEAENMTKKSIALRLKVTLKELDTLIASAKKSGGVGVRESDKNHRDTLIMETSTLSSIVNLATGYHRKVIPMTDKEKISAFEALAVIGDTLTTHCKTAFPPVGGMTMLWCPSCQDKTKDDGLAPYIGGWGDGSKNMRYQYAPRKCPISKRSGYRDDSFQVSIYNLHPEKPELEKPKVKPEA